jgi:hypothetical protein
MTAHESQQTQLRRVIVLGDHDTLGHSERLDQQAAQHGAIIVERRAFGRGEARSTGTLHEVPGIIEALGRAIELRAHIWVPFPMADLAREQHVRRLDLALERHGLDLLLGRHLMPCPEVGVNSIDFALRAEVHAVDQLDQAALASAGLRTLAGDIELALAQTAEQPDCQPEIHAPRKAAGDQPAPPDSEYPSAPEDSEPALTPAPAPAPVLAHLGDTAAPPAHRCAVRIANDFDTTAEATRPAPRSTTRQPIHPATRRNTTMSTEVTASVMIGAIRPNSVHGQPSEDGAPRPFAPSHVMVLMEGHRATWILQRCPNLGRPSPTLRIRPSSPAYLLAAGLLGYVALTHPRVIRESDELRNLIEVDDRRGEVRVQPLDEDSACRIVQQLSEHAYGVVTVLPGSTITATEVNLAADRGSIQAAALAPPIAESSVNR